MTFWVSFSGSTDISEINTYFGKVGLSFPLPKIIITND